MVFITRWISSSTVFLRFLDFLSLLSCLTIINVLTTIADIGLYIASCFQPLPSSSDLRNSGTWCGEVTALLGDLFGNP